MKKPIPFGKYYLLERINVGGMAEVFRAKAYGVEGFERLVAVKRILPNIAEDKEFIGMFVDEAKIAVQLNHANIAQIFDLGMVDGAYYIALEHIHGRDLRAIYDRCREQGAPMPIAQAAFVIMKVCEGLDYAHNKRDQSGRDLHLVHRDVSPQNVLVSFEGEVKLIDFGIAKAAGKGAKTQAGILKGKFGYMSPEQVRGLPIDRRTDIFSCGIVLYELLTGERLFVGESDFSTLEKVRNVEILPPSTYNRKIPDELERIVLKALAKNVEDRYQNAIDLHDDLQAFVYTAGEFYSRKDLAAWMKKMFTREIEEETAKLESYRQLRPPETRGSQNKRSQPAIGGQRRPTQPSVATKPPPIPGNGRRATSQMGATPPPPAGAATAPAGSMEEDDENRLEWDEDELETQIYAGSEDAKAVAVAAMAAKGMAGKGAAETLPLSSRPASNPGIGVQAAGGGLSPAISSPVLPLAPDTPLAPSATPTPPPAFPVGSNPSSPAPLSAPLTASLADPLGVDEILSGNTDRLNAPEPARARAVSVVDLAAADSFSTGTVATLQKPPPRKGAGTGLYLGLTAIVLLAAAGAGSYLVLQRGEGKSEAAATIAANPAAEPQISREVLAATGFDLIIDPKEAKVKLDDELLDLAPPMKIRNIQPGEHTLVIQGPPGFYSKKQAIMVEAGKAEQLSIALDPLEIVGRFRSQPEGATVTLIVNDTEQIALGPAPQDHKLDPRKRYAVRFEKEGYATKTEVVSLSGASEERVSAVLEPATPAEGTDTSPDGTKSTQEAPAKQPAKSGGSGNKSSSNQDSARKPATPGVLMLGSKPPCQIFINGQDTGMKTPQRDISLPPGRHRVMLVNAEFGIKESFVVVIKSGEETKKIVDLTDRMQAQ